MMNKDKTTPVKRLKLLWALPVIALLLVSFAKPNYVSGENPNTVVGADEKTITVTGKVTDENGKPLPGTSIVVKNSSTGAVSDAQGKYTLTGIKPDDEIVFSFVGYGTKVVKAASKLNVSMSKEVFVIGYANNQMAPPPPPPPPSGKNGEINNVSSSKTAVDNDYQSLFSMKGGGVAKREIEYLKIGENGTKPLILIDGKESDIDINQIDPNTILQIQVYGSKLASDELGIEAKDGVVLISLKKDIAPPPPPPFTIRSKDGGNPLIVIDGKVSTVDLNTIDPNTIDRIEVLKDQSATAVYGDKGKDGVILITTKKNIAPPPPPPASDEVFIIVEDMPEFPGGQTALGDYITKKAAAANEKGFAEVRFLVDTDGKVKDVKAVSTESDKLNKLATEIIAGFPRWKPGMQRGKAVPVMMQIGIDFGSKCITTKHKFMNEK